MKPLVLMLLLLLAPGAPAQAQEKLRVLCIGAHPDDCDIKAGGLSGQVGLGGARGEVRGGDQRARRPSHAGGKALAARRRAEAAESGRRAGITYQVLGEPDGELLPRLDARRAIIRQIRAWRADLVLSPRTNDYHPNHRYTAVLVQDAAYLVTVPNLVPDTPALRRNPVFAYLADRSRGPRPSAPTWWWQSMTSSSASWTCWTRTSRSFTSGCPGTPAARQVPRTRPPAGAGWPPVAGLRGVRSGSGARALARVAEQALRGTGGGRQAEAIEIAEYGRQPDEAEIRRLFPFFQ